MEQRAGDRLADDAMRIANQLAAAAAAHEEDGEDAAELRTQVFRLTIVAGDRLRGLGIEDTASRLAEAAQADLPDADLAEVQRQRAMALARIGQLSDAADAARIGLEAARRSSTVHCRPASAPWSGRSTAPRRHDIVHRVPRAGADARRRPADGSRCGRGHRQPGVRHRPARTPAEAIALAERSLILAHDDGLADREVRCLNAHGAAVLLQGNIEGYTDFMRALTRALEAGLGHESTMAYHNLAELQLQGVGTASSSEMNERASTSPSVEGSHWPPTGCGPTAWRCSSKPAVGRSAGDRRHGDRQ